MLGWQAPRHAVLPSSVVRVADVLAALAARNGLNDRPGVSTDGFARPFAPGS